MLFISFTGQLFLSLLAYVTYLENLLIAILPDIVVLKTFNYAMRNHMVVSYRPMLTL